jgi:hypothetical protein
LGGDFVSDPRGVSLKPGRLDVIGVGVNTRQIQHWWWDGSWGGPEPLGGPVDSATAEWRKPGLFDNHLELFAVASSNKALLHGWWDGAWHDDGSFFSHSELGRGKPCAISWAPDLFDVFAITSTTTLTHWWWNSDGWHQEWLGGTLAKSSSVSAVTWGPGRLDVFGTDANTHALQHWWWPTSGGGWNGPEPWGGALSSSPSVVSWESGRLDVFGIDSQTRTLQHWWWPA